MNLPTRVRIAALLTLGLLAAACETTPIQPSTNFAGDMEVVTDYASFFRLGPQQAGGADRSLRLKDRVMLLRKEFGYSRVQLEDDQVGYMANEDIKPVPPEARKKPESRRSSPGRGRASSEEEFYDQIDLPDPNLDIMPEDVPLEPLPDLLPESVDTPAPAAPPQPQETAPASAPAPAAENTPVSTST
ncbi:MAG: hypothetical protein FGM15_02350 [Chthoniobacterales bacterium]|nr:hypothetical protein [Chthoniobacterales bacterium]